MATSNSPFPRWKQLIAQGIKDGMAQQKKGSLHYALGTVELAKDESASSSSSSSSSSSTMAAPHVRMVVHRGFVNEQRSESSDTGVEPFNDRFGSNTCMLTTTDIRAPKAQQIITQTQAQHAGKAARGEVCWWMEHAMLQFRIAGTLYVLPRANHPATKLFNAQQLSPLPSDALTSSNDTQPQQAFDWQGERRRIFEKLSPDLLASFTRPNPSQRHPNASDLHGKPGPGQGDADAEKDDVNSPWTLQLPQPGKEENVKQKQELQESERNFALIVIDPDSVDVVDLARDRRSLFTRVDEGPNSDWKEERLVP